MGALSSHQLAGAATAAARCGLQSISAVCTGDKMQMYSHVARGCAALLLAALVKSMAHDCPSVKQLASSLCPQALTQAVGALLAAIEPGLGVVLAATHKHAHAAGRLAAGQSVQGMATTVLVPGVKGNSGVDALRVNF